MQCLIIMQMEDLHAYLCSITWHVMHVTCAGRDKGRKVKRHKQLHGVASASPHTPTPSTSPGVSASSGAGAGGYSQWREESEWEDHWNQWDWPPHESWTPQPWQQSHWDRSSTWYKWNRHAASPVTPTTVAYSRQSSRSMHDVDISEDLRRCTTADQVSFADRLGLVEISLDGRWSWFKQLTSGRKLRS